MSSTLQDELCCPPTASGAVALASTEGLLKWLPMRASVHRKLLRCQAELSVFAGDIMLRISVCRDADAAASLRDELRRRHDEVDRLYRSYVSLDAMVRKAQMEIESAYPAFRPVSNDDLAFVNTEAEGDTSTSSESSAPSTPVAASAPLVPQYGDRLSERMYMAIKDPSIIDQFIDVRETVAAIEKCQALVRGAAVRRRYRTLLRLRREFEEANVAYQFRWWRAEARATTFRRKTLARLGLSGLQANANIVLVTRQQFGRHLSRARTIATLRRSLVLWYRYTKYLQAPVDPATHERAVAFGYPFAAWDSFLVTENKRIAMQEKCALFGGGRDPLLVCAHYLHRWKRFVRMGQEERHRLVVAVTHHELVTCRKHFAAWVYFVSFQAQLEAHRKANLEYYMQRWLRGAAMQKSEADSITNFTAAKKLTVLCKWRRKALDFRQKQSMAVAFAQANRGNILHCLLYWIDSPLAVFVGAFQRWRALVRRRGLWKSFVAARWSARAHALKLSAFAAWAKFVAEAQDRPLRMRSKGSERISVLVPANTVVDDFQLLSFRHQLKHSTRNVHAANAVTPAIPTTGELADFGFPADAVNQFEKECGHLQSLESLQRDTETSREGFRHWQHVGGADPSMGHAVVQLLVLVAFRKFQRAEQAESILSRSRPVEEEGRDPVPQRHALLREVFISTGLPLADVNRKEFAIGAFEASIAERARTFAAQRIRLMRRADRVNRRSAVLIAASRVVAVDRYFDSFSPYRMLVEKYEEMARSEKQYRRGNKFTVALPPLRRAKQLRFLLRLQLPNIVGVTGRHRILVRQRQESVLASVIAYARLATLLQDSHRGDSQQAAKRQLVASSMTLREARELSNEFMERKYRKAVMRPPSSVPANLPPMPPVMLDTVGFNPKWLRGEQQRRAAHGAKLRKAMRAVADDVKAYYGEVQDDLRRTVSDCAGFAQVRKAGRRREKRRHSVTVLSPADAQRATARDLSASDSESTSPVQASPMLSTPGSTATKRSATPQRVSPRPVVPVPAAIPPSAVTDPVSGDDQLDSARRTPSKETAEKEPVVKLAPPIMLVAPVAPDRPTVTQDQPRSPSSSSSDEDVPAPTRPQPQSSPVRAEKPSVSPQQQREEPPIAPPKRPASVTSVASPSPVKPPSRQPSGQSVKSALSTSRKSDPPSSSDATARAVQNEVHARADDEEVVVDQPEASQAPKAKQTKRRRRFVAPAPVIATKKAPKPRATPAQSGQDESVSWSANDAPTPPRIAGSRDARDPCPSVEHLLEVSARFSEKLTRQSQLDLDAIKMRLAEVVVKAGRSDVDPTSAVPDPVSARVAEEASEFLRESEGSEPSRRMQLLAEKRAAMRDAPLVPHSDVRYRFDASRFTKQRRYQPDDEAVAKATTALMKHRDSDTPEGSPAAHGRRAQHLADTDVTVSRDFSRHQMIRVARRSASNSDTVHAAMESTAALMNSTATDGFAFRAPPEHVSLGDLSSETLDALHSRPRPESRAHRRLAEALGRSAEHVEHPSNPVQPVVSDEAAESDNWFKMLARETRENRNTLIAERRDLLRRRLHRLETLEPGNARDALRNATLVQLAQLDQSARGNAPRRQPLRSQSASRHQPRAAGAAVPPPSRTPQPDLSDKEVGRLVSYIVTQSQVL